MISAPSLSVLMPVRNAAKYLREAINSIQTQTFSDFEFIAINDGSSDDSVNILNRAAADDPRMLVLTPSETGFSNALNAGLAVAKGKWIARMDADDIALPNRFASQIHHLEQNPACVAVGTAVLYVDPERAPLKFYHPHTAHIDIVKSLLDGNGGSLVHPTVVIRRSALEKAGAYRSQYDALADLDIYLRLSKVGELANLPDVHLHYRQHLKSSNRTVRCPEGMRDELTNPYRKEHGLPALPLSLRNNTVPLTNRVADWRRYWSYQAAGLPHWKSARKNALYATAYNPFDWKNWQCLKYVLTAAAKGRTAHS